MPTSIPCPCGEEMVPEPLHPGAFWCLYCGTFQFFISQDAVPPFAPGDLTVPEKNDWGPFDAP